MVGFLITLLVAVVMLIVSYILMPKPKAPKPQAAQQMDNPVAEAGIERPVIWGTGIIKELNCLWFGDKRLHEYEIKA
jgi:preprotein translocase subunit YajC